VGAHKRRQLLIEIQKSAPCYGFHAQMIYKSIPL
jgi:hypothetical protein